MKFKIDDKVRLLQPLYGLPKGADGVIQEVEPLCPEKLPYGVFFEGFCSVWLKEEDLVLVSPTEVTKPNHYSITVKGVNFDVIDLIQALDVGFELGNALKYIIRAGKKQDNPTEQDLSKAVECIKRRIDFIGAK